jgi:hypothetical protein
MFSHLDQLLDQEFDHTENEKMVDNFSFLLDDKELLECFLNLPDADNIPFALDLAQIAQGQDADNIPFALDLAQIAQGQEQDQELWQ